MNNTIALLYFIAAVSGGIIVGHILYEGVQMVTDIVEDLYRQWKNR